MHYAALFLKKDTRMWAGNVWIRQHFSDVDRKFGIDGVVVRLTLMIKKQFACDDDFVIEYRFKIMQVISDNPHTISVRIKLVTCASERLTTCMMRQ